MVVGQSGAALRLHVFKRGIARTCKLGFGVRLLFARSCKLDFDGCPKASVAAHHALLLLLEHTYALFRNGWRLASCASRRGPMMVVFCICVLELHDFAVERCWRVFPVQDYAPQRWILRLRLQKIKPRGLQGLCARTAFSSSAACGWAVFGAQVFCAVVRHCFVGAGRALFRLRARLWPEGRAQSEVGRAVIGPSARLPIRGGRASFMNYDGFVQLLVCYARSPAPEVQLPTVAHRRCGRSVCVLVGCFGPRWALALERNCCRETRSQPLTSVWRVGVGAVAVGCLPAQ